MPLLVVAECKIQIMLVDAHEIFRIGVKSLLNNHSKLQIVAEADSFVAALEQTPKKFSPDIILLDFALKDGNCVTKIPELLKKHPKSKVVLFINNDDQPFQLYALRLGISGVLQKNCSAELLARAIEKIHEGELWFDRNLTQSFLQSEVKNHQSDLTSLVATLNAREKMIVCLAAKGASAKKIGVTLSVAEKTVRNQLSIIYSKLNIKNHVELCLQFSKFDLCKSFCCEKHKIC
ncbi:MAG: response regulator transcription factor [Methylococcaceae bacterium]